MKKNNSVHIQVPINSSKITNQRLLFVVFIRTPPKNMQKIFRLLLYELCQNALWRSYYWIFLVMLLFQETFPSSRFIYALNTNFEGTSKLTMSAFGFDLIFLRFFHALSKEIIAMECFDVVIFSSLSLSRRSKASIRTKFKPNYTGLHYEKTMSLARVYRAGFTSADKIGCNIFPVRMICAELWCQIVWEHFPQLCVKFQPLRGNWVICF